MPTPGSIVETNGIQSCLGAFERIRDGIVPTVQQGLEESGEYVLGLACYYCPIDTGALRASGRLRVADNLGPKTLRLWITFGGKVGFDAPGTVGSSQKGTLNKGWRKVTNFAPAELQGQVVYYAVYVHENTLIEHAAPTQAKFLERAVRESLAEVSRIMGRRVDSLVKADRSDANAIKNFGRLKIIPPAGG